MATENTNDIKRKQGDDFPIVVTLTENKQPISLGGSETVTFLKKNEDNTIEAIEGSITDASIAKLSFDPTVSLVADPGRFTYAIKINDGSYTTTYSVAILEIEENLMQ